MALPQVVDGWHVEIFQSVLPRVDNLVVLPDQTVYATLELGQGRGQLIRIREGRVISLLKGLNRPDGLTYYRQRLYITEEVSRGRVLDIDIPTHEVRVLARLRHPEGIEMDEKGTLYISEDRVSGRILALVGDQTRVHATNLNRPEGLCIGPDQKTLYVAETSTGRVLALNHGQKKVIVEGLHEPDQVECGKDGAIWITEDQKSGRLLRYFHGAVRTVAWSLAEPQGISLGKPGEVYVSEQGKNRILKLVKSGKVGNPTKPRN